MLERKNKVKLEWAGKGSALSLVVLFGIMLCPVGFGSVYAEEVPARRSINDVEWNNCYNEETGLGLPRFDGGEGCNEHASLVDAGTGILPSATLVFGSGTADGNGYSTTLVADGQGTARGRIFVNAHAHVENAGSYRLYLSTNGSVLSGEKDGNRIVTIGEHDNYSFEQLPKDRWGIAWQDSTSYDDLAYKAAPEDQVSIAAGENGKTYYDGATDIDRVISIATAISANTPADNYSSILTLSLVATPDASAIKFNGITTMQALTPEICARAAVNDTAYLQDIRDGNKYWVTKLADGNCWMSQNLALNLSTKESLSIAKGSASDYTPEADTIKTHLPTEDCQDGPTKKDYAIEVNERCYNRNAYNIVINGVVSNDWVELAPVAFYSWDDGRYVVVKPEGAYNTGAVSATMIHGGIDAYSNNTMLDSGNVPIGASSSRTDEYGIVMRVETEGDTVWTASLDPNFTVSSTYEGSGKTCEKIPGYTIGMDEECGNVYDAHYLVGNHYQWNAAAARAVLRDTTGEWNTEENVTTGICPSNWVLPSSSYADVGNGSARNLLQYYNLLTVTRPDNANATDNISVSPTFATRAGYVGPNAHGLWNIGRHMYWWSATDIPASQTNTYSIYADEANVNPSGSRNMAHGLAVRCLVMSSHVEN